jgi:hypothetical protein
MKEGFRQIAAFPNMKVVAFTNGTIQWSSTRFCAQKPCNPRRRDPGYYLIDDIYWAIQALTGGLPSFGGKD